MGVLDTEQIESDPNKITQMQPPPSIFHPANLSYPAFAHYHVSEFESLDRYPHAWAIFGCLTYAKNPPQPSTQLKDFEHLMKSLGTLNHSHPDLLHYFVRVEHSSSERWHLHFLLGHERVTNGRHTPMTVQTACDFLKSQWFHGDAKVVPYDQSEDGVGYVTKIRDPQLTGLTWTSPSLFKLLKKLPSSPRRPAEIKEIARYHSEDRDPLATQLVIKLRRKGNANAVCFMDEIASRMVA